MPVTASPGAFTLQEHRPKAVCDSFRGPGIRLSAYHPECDKIVLGCPVLSGVMQQYLFQIAASLPKLTLMGVVDILVVAILIYELILIVRGTRAAHILSGILTLIVIYNLSTWLKLE